MRETMALSEAVTLELDEYVSLAVETLNQYLLAKRPDILSREIDESTAVVDRGFDVTVGDGL